MTYMHRASLHISICDIGPRAKECPRLAPSVPRSRDSLVRLFPATTTVTKKLFNPEDFGLGKILVGACIVGSIHFFVDHSCLLIDCSFDTYQAKHFS